MAGVLYSTGWNEIYSQQKLQTPEVRFHKNSNLFKLLGREKGGGSPGLAVLLGCDLRSRQ
jgi:hypothetical protein